MKFIPTPLLALMALPMVPGTLARPSSCKAKVVAPKAIYTISNDQQNAVVAMHVQADGMVGKATSTATGGTGANGIDGSKNEPSAPDALFSQSALTVAGKMLFAVNAGSNTVSMFAIDAADSTKLTMVGKPAAVPGEFPTTASDKNKTFHAFHSSLTPKPHHDDRYAKRKACFPCLTRNCVESFLLKNLSTLYG
ncbi:hypothetical protein PG985_005406 [Apiospora marii]|uniref:uncharacterized protein n=1 Tax=Apiospora marii TaxID=335849 RepID=UPI0031301E55